MSEPAVTPRSPTMDEKHVLKQGFEAQAKALREFGYPDATAEMVAEAHRKWKLGEPMAGIVEMMCERAFNDYPQIFGEPERSP